MRCKGYIKTTVGNISSINSSSYSPKEAWKFVNYLDTSNIIKNQVNEIQYYDLRNDKLPSRAKRKVKYNSIIYSTVRPNHMHYGIIKSQPENFLVSTGFAVIDVDPIVADADYLYYILSQQSTIQELQSIAEENTSAYPAINPADIGNLSIELPPLEIQKKIAQTLKSFDDKIELNNRINDNLQRQAQALYKSWFVDFEPFGGEMPEGWEIGSLYDYADIIYGAPFSSNLFNDRQEGLPLVRIRDLKSQTLETYTTEQPQKGYLLQPGDIVAGMDGDFTPYIWGNEAAWLNQRVCVFSNKRPNGKAFILFTIWPQLMQVQETQPYTTVVHIGKRDFDRFTAIIPDEETLFQFEEITAPMIELMVKNRLTNKRLSLLRDALLPKLMSGEIDISEVKL